MITSDEITALLNTPNLKYKWNYTSETNTLTVNGFSIDLRERNFTELRDWLPLLARFDADRHRQYCKDNPL